MQSRANHDFHSPDPCPHDGEVFAHLGPHHGKGGKSWVTYLLAVGMTVLQTQPFSDSCKDNSPELGPLGGVLSPVFPLPFPVHGTVPFPPVTPGAGGEAGWKLQDTLRVLFCTRGGGRPVFSGGDTRL